MPRNPDAERAIEAMILGRAGTFGPYDVRGGCHWGLGYVLGSVQYESWILWVVGKAKTGWLSDRAYTGSLVCWIGFKDDDDYFDLFETMEGMLGEPPAYTPDVGAHVTVILGPLGVAAWRAELLARQPQP